MEFHLSTSNVIIHAFMFIHAKIQLKYQDLKC